MTPACPFCPPEPSRVFLRLPRVCALWDGFPVSEGHALIVPHRHIATLFDATAEERAALFGAIESVCSVIRDRFGADGFNVGINLGEAAGQTVPHLHLHVMPRRHGDVADPRGGVRHVIPGKGNYLAPAGLTPPATRFTAREPRLAEAVLTTGGTDPLLPRLEQDLAEASRVDIAVAFVMHSGVERLYPHFEDLLARNGVLRLLTGDYLDVSDPDALQRLVDLQTLHGEARCQLRMFVSEGRSFHPKAYLASQAGGGGVAYVGSSNLSGSALQDGVEWNYRVASARDAAGWQQVRDAFEALFGHPSTRALDAPWLAHYRTRRRAPSLRALTDHPLEPPPDAPAPNQVQQEALAALQATREAGNRAGLVVMATGLGKTWLAAFDTARPSFARILFVAHREEILNQAVATFRRIRPSANIGLYHGAERAPQADILFASIQTLSRPQHLERFAPDAFDYVVVDEFHHAAAATYRRLINYFEPAFLLGLTATPERTDGGNLLALCGENRVYQCAVPRGIELGLLCEFDYFGVPDEVDYRSISWRNNRFAEEELTAAVATQRRAENILDQWRKRGGAKTIGFCVSQRHADFMREWFRDHGVACAAVHSGATSDARAVSLERLAAGELQVVFAVDMFNEGVDVPAIDTVMMLRPTESAIVWLQQFGRGLRKLGEKRLKVVDYIGNHRSFLLKVRALLDMQREGDAALREALERVRLGEWTLPVGCSVTYELQAMDILRALLRDRPGEVDALREYYEDFKERHGERPTASEAFRNGYLPQTASRGYGSWFGLVRAMGDLDAGQLAAMASAGEFLAGLEATRMNRSYKMLVLQAMLNADVLPGQGMALADLVAGFARLAGRSETLRADVGVPLDDMVKLREVIRDPIDAWTGRHAIKGALWFAYEDGRLRFTGSVADESRDGFQRMVRELVEWRLAEYLARPGSDAGDDAAGAGGFVMRVSQANGRPILFLPDRATTQGIPQGWTAVLVNGKAARANFVKIAVNVVNDAEGEENQLPALLRGWFGPDAGQPGTDHKVVCEHDESGWAFKPVVRREDAGLEVFRRYSREQIPRALGEQFNPATWNAGFVPVPTGAVKHLCLLVTLHKGDMAKEFQYGDRFLSPDHFQWQSQNRTKQGSSHGRMIRDHAELGIQVHLFVRKEKKRGSMAAPFVYCGPVTFEAWEGESPITVRWRLQGPVLERLYSEFKATG